jgi:hypothetical protein
MDSQSSSSQDFPYYFCLMIGLSGAGPRTDGSGSRRPKSIWIRNTAKDPHYLPNPCELRHSS